MKSNINSLNEESMLGPGTDLVISLVAVLVVLMSISMASFQNQEKQMAELKEDLDQFDDYDNLKDQIDALKTQLNAQKSILENKTRELESLADINALRKRNVLLDRVRISQLEIIQQIAQVYRSEAKTKDSLVYKIIISKGAPLEDTITIVNDVSLQRISFGEKILFGRNSDLLQQNGQASISTVGSIFKEKLSIIKEINVQGHADTHGDENYNLQLASHRAIAVFEHLRNIVKIDPIKHLMSISSYGEYKPVLRSVNNFDFDAQQLNEANADRSLRNRNRRIEIVLNYRGDFIAK